MLPGGRIPDPSVLRTHPATADRIERLLALKAAPGGPASGGFPAGRRAGRPLPRPSLVPRVPGRSDRPLPGGAGLHGEDSGAGTGRSLRNRTAEPSDQDRIDDERPACDVPLASPDGDPRIRFMRGGVWW